MRVDVHAIRSRANDSATTNNVRGYFVERGVGATRAETIAMADEIEELRKRLAELEAPIPTFEEAWRENAADGFPESLVEHVRYGWDLRSQYPKKPDPG